MNCTHYTTVVRNGEEIELTTIGNVDPPVRGRSYGPPEDCYPDEGGNVEIERVELDGKPWSDELTAAEEREACVAMFEHWAYNCADSDERDRDDWDDR